VAIEHTGSDRRDESFQQASQRTQSAREGTLFEHLEAVLTMPGAAVAAAAMRAEAGQRLEQGTGTKSSMLQRPRKGLRQHHVCGLLRREYRSTAMCEGLCPGRHHVDAA
jgi:hypothetical protein